MKNPEELLKLKPDWDSYGAPSIHEITLEKAQVFLRSVEYVPLPDGGVQLEWHIFGVNLEIEFHPDGIVEVVK
jgi:hypothetical protein